MSNLEFYTPDDIPSEVEVYGSEVKQLQVGKAGKIGALTLLLEQDQERGKTVVKEQYSKVPLFTQRALYLEESLPSMAYVHIMSPSGGILQGDRYRMDLAKNQKDTLRFIDVAVLEPKKRNLKTLGILDTFDVVGSTYILTKANYVKELKDEINSVLHRFMQISGGASILPYNSGVIVRMLGNVASDVRNAIYEIIKITRRIIINASFSGTM